MGLINIKAFLCSAHSSSPLICMATVVIIYILYTENILSLFWNYWVGNISEYFKDYTDIPLTVVQP